MAPALPRSRFKDDLGISESKGYLIVGSFFIRVLLFGVLFFKGPRLFFGNHHLHSPRNGMCNQELLQSSLLSLAPDCLKAATALGRVQGG